MDARRYAVVGKMAPPEPDIQESIEIFDAMKAFGLDKI